MDKYYPKGKDNSPKRSKDKYNPYTIFSVGSETDSPHYYVSFKDGQGVHICMEIEKELFDILNEFELEDVAYINEWKRHYDLKDHDEVSINKQAISVPLTVEEIILEQIEEEQLHKAISLLPEKLRHRIELYYFEEMTYEEIALIEGCSKSAIKYSIDNAKKKIKKYLKNF